MNLDKWARDIQREVFQYWKENHSDWEHGIKVFYGPVNETAELLIVGYQPGGDASSFPPARERFESGDFSLPETHEYLSTDWPIAKEMRTLFGPNEGLLGESVKTNINFFRAPDIDYWEAHLDKERRDEMQAFCNDCIEEIFEEIEPSVIIAEGIRTWDELQYLLDLETENCAKRGRSRLVCTSEGSNPKVIGFMHPSGARISNEDKNRIQDELLGTLETHTSYKLTHD